MMRTKTILVVDGAEGVRRLIRDVLAPEGWSVLEARDGSEAVLMAERHDGPIDLVLADVDMPCVDGFAFARRLLRHRRRVGLLFISAQSGDELRRIGLSDDAPNFLPKPFRTGDMVRKAAAILEAAAN